jgi:hypothetical protein
MDRRAKAVVLAALAAVLGAVGCAGTREAGRDVQAIIPGLEQTRVGVVTNVQGQNIAVASVEDPAAPAAWFNVGADTTVERNGQRVELGMLEEGTPVRVRFEPATGPERAMRVEVLTGAEAEQVREKAQQLGY